MSQDYSLLSPCNGVELKSYVMINNFIIEDKGKLRTAEKK